MDAQLVQDTKVLAPIYASVLHGIKDLRIEQRNLSPPSSDEVQVAIRATGLCGSDLHYYKHYRNGDIMMKEPMALGHESAGVVVALGSSVEGLSLGDKVALEVGRPCEACERCAEGRYNICRDMRFAASARNWPHTQGTLQERMNHPAKWCHKLPSNVSLELGALVEPLSVAIHASRRANLEPGSTVLVFGAGTVGLLVAAVAKISGSGTIVIADIDSSRVDFAVNNKFAHKGFTVSMKRGSSVGEDLRTAKDTASKIGETIKDNGERVGEVDAVFECTGVPSCVQAGIYASRPGGKLLLIGMGTPVQTLPISAASLREVDLIGVFRYANTYPTGIEVVSKMGADYPNFSKLITHRYTGLENAPNAFEMASKTKDEDGKQVIKVMLNIPGNGIAKL